MNNYSTLLNTSNIFLKLTTAKSHKLDKEKLSSFTVTSEARDYLLSLGFPLIGMGSSRWTFAINSRKAIKLIKRPGGRNQNIKEYEVLTECASSIIPRIYDHDPNFSWIEVELVRPLKSDEEFKQLTGINMIDFKAFAYAFQGLDIRRLEEEEEYTTPEHDADGNITYLTPKQRVYEDVSDNQFVKNVMALYNKSNISLIELTECENLGVNTNGNIVVLDLGISHL